MVDCVVDNNFAVTEGGGGYFWGSPREAISRSSTFCGNVPDEYAGPDYEFLQRAIDWAQAKLDVLAESQR